MIISPSPHGSSSERHPKIAQQTDNLALFGVMVFFFFLHLTRGIVALVLLSSLPLSLRGVLL